MAAPAPAENCKGSGSGSGSGEMITLMSCDGERFEVAEAAARLSQTIAHMIEDDCAGGSGGIPLPNVNAKTLARILEYCNKHVDDADAEADGTEGAAGFVAKKKALEIFDAGFIDVDKDVLYDVLLAANYLEVKGLLDLACQKVANMIKGKKPEEIRQAFGIVNDFTPEEEEEIRKENAWAFE